MAISGVQQRDAELEVLSSSFLKFIGHFHIHLWHTLIKTLNMYHVQLLPLILPEKKTAFPLPEIMIPLVFFNSYVVFFFFFLLSVTFYRWHILNLNANLEFSFMYFAFYKAFQATWNRCNEILKYILNMYLGFLKKSKNTNEVQNIHKHSKAQIWQVRCNLERYIRIL